MRSTIAITCICLAALSACTPKLQISEQAVPVTPTSPKQSLGLDVFAAARQQGQPVPVYLGERLVTVRSVFDGSSGTSEFSGARCKITSSAFTAEVTTPVQIIVPNYGQQSPVITADCRANEMRATQSISVFNASQRRRNRSSSGLFLSNGYGRHRSGVSVGLHFDLSDRSKDIYEYPTLRVKFR